MEIAHQKQWEFLKGKFEHNQLSHTYLFTGAEHIGKKEFALELAKLVNCLDKKNAPCQKCAHCQAIKKNTFPDIKIIAKKEDKNEIDIAQIREVQQFLSYKSYYGLYKTVVVVGAEEMNQEAQSCFLKTLEEPKGQTLIILISSKPDMMLPTIFSRCQQVRFSKPKGLAANPERVKKEQAILKDLLLAIGSDFAAKYHYVKSIDFEKQDARGILREMEKYVREALLAKLGIANHDAYPNFKKYSVQDIKRILEAIGKMHHTLTFANANQKLALEIVLMEF